MRGRIGKYCCLDSPNQGQPGILDCCLFCHACVQPVTKKRNERFTKYAATCDSSRLQDESCQQIKNCLNRIQLRWRSTKEGFWDLILLTLAVSACHWLVNPRQTFSTPLTIRGWRMSCSGFSFGRGSPRKPSGMPGRWWNAGWLPTSSWRMTVSWLECY